MMPTIKIDLPLIAVLVITLVAGLSLKPACSAHPDYGLLVLSYHDINDAPTTNFNVSEEAFKAHMKQLKVEGYHSI